MFPISLFRLTNYQYLIAKGLQRTFLADIIPPLCAEALPPAPVEENSKEKRFQDFKFVRIDTGY